MDENPLEGMRVLVMEDEFLIAMDVEELCREHGAREVVLARSLDDLPLDLPDGLGFDAAILDVMVAGRSTLELAQALVERRIPFVFATGYAGADALFEAVAGIEVVEKPYAGEALIAAMARAVARTRVGSGGV